MKFKKISIILGTVAVSAVLLAGCRPRVVVPNNGSENETIKSEIESIMKEDFGYVTENGSWTAPGGTGGENPTSEIMSGSFPGGLDDDGRDPSEIGVKASTIDFKLESNSEEATHKAHITGYDVSGRELWDYETRDIYIGQIDNLQEIITTNDAYIFLEEGDIVALDLENGHELWRNKDFKGGGLNWTMNYEGDTLYMCGYFGPDLFVMDFDGNTLNRITSKDPDIYWAYHIEYINENRVDVTYENNDTVVSYDPMGPAEQ